MALIGRIQDLYKRWILWSSDPSRRGYLILTIVLIFIVPLFYLQRYEDQKHQRDNLAAVVHSRKQVDKARYVAALKSCKRQNVARKAANAGQRATVDLIGIVQAIADIETAARKAGKDKSKDALIVDELLTAKARLTTAQAKIFFVAQVKCEDVIPKPS